ncbi:MAG: glycine--tRNA ligase subunit beta [Planctomycetota bacterium]|nr:glycine--tRNA ligase subunit beta [Planctomycetota bacterium]
MPDLLFEIGAEEIPAGYIEPALAALKSGFENALKSNRLEAKALRTTGTPRRLILHAAGLPSMQESIDMEVAGPPRRVAFDGEGKPTRAAEGFARKNGVDVSEVMLRETDKGEYCYVVTHVEGKPTAEILQGVLSALIETLPFPKSMYWLTPSTRFARPVRSILAIFDKDVVPFEYSGVASGRKTAGHPFLGEDSVSIESADFNAFESALEANKVVADLDKRRDQIESQLAIIYASYGSSHNQPELVEEVKNLVEWPHAIEGSFEEDYLEVPAEVIEAAMMGHQRYFPVRNSDGDLVNKFAFVSNRDGSHDDVIRTGNERVLRARLSDARFFWDEDRKTRLADRVEALKDVLYQVKLGSYYERTERLRSMAGFIADKLGLDEATAGHLDRAAMLCKTDLLTNMVYEFAKLQGVMGRHYALQDGEHAAVANAIEEHYLPKQAAGALPESDIGAFLALAEKADTVSSCFAAGLSPTASQDPYGLRRQTLGIIRILLEKNISISLRAMFEHGLSNLPDSLEVESGVLDQILDFVRDRLNHFFLDAGYRYDLVNAALSAGFENLLDLKARLDAITELSKQNFWTSLVKVVERTFNITKKSQPTGDLCTDLLKEELERAVFHALKENEDEIRSLFEQRDFVAAARRYHDVFAEPIEKFFADVMVLVDDEAIKNNRLLLMKNIHDLIADHLGNLGKEVVLGGEN